MTRFLRLKEVMSRTGKGRSSIYADPTFPRPVKIGDRAVAWVEEEIDAWLERCIAEREAPLQDRAVVGINPSGMPDPAIVRLEARVEQFDQLIREAGE